MRKPRALPAHRLVTNLVTNFLETGEKHATLWNPSETLTLYGLHK